jgi:ATP-dependent DNA helicase MPH1
LADSDDAEALASSPVAPRSRRSGSQASDAIEVEDSEPENGSLIVLTSSPLRSSGPQALLNCDMPPPAVPPPRLRLGVDVTPLLLAPSPSFPVRPGRYRAKKNLVQIADSSSSPLQPPPPSQKRLHRRHSSHHDDSDPDPLRPPSPPKKRKRAGSSSGRPKRRIKVRDTAAAARSNPWIDVEAGHSGNEVSSGASSRSDEEGEGEGESESDRRFAGDFAATQPSPSYDQSAVYRRSLLSQAPAAARARVGGRGNDGTISVPVFAAPPVRRSAPLGRVAAAVAAAPGRERIARSSSPAPPDEEDYYMLGSFVVDDDAEISFMQSSDP